MIERLLIFLEGESLSDKTDSMPMPVPVSRLLYGSLAVTYISETLAACREINSDSLSLIIEMLIKVVFNSAQVRCLIGFWFFQISYCNRHVSMLVLEELIKLYSSSNSSELKNLSTITVEIMVSWTWIEIYIKYKLSSSRFQFVAFAEIPNMFNILIKVFRRESDSRLTIVCPFACLYIGISI